MKIKTGELDGFPLNWAAAQCLNEGKDPDDKFYITDILSGYFSPSTDWAQGGPIIEREGITLFSTDDYEWAASYGATQFFRSEMPTSPTPLIAAMRCYVASKLGDEVDIPEELR
jgi:hypothetical protein